MRRIVIAAGLLCLMTFTMVGLKNQQAISLLLHCRTFASDSACFIDSVSQELPNNPEISAATLNQIATLRRIGLIGGDFRAYSLILHHLGSMYFMQGINFETLNQRCPRLVKDGCAGFAIGIRGDFQPNERSKSVYSLFIPLLQCSILSKKYKIV